ncbi:substrate-binding periplasmic protein [Zooshikella harenae]|uniref:Transporter substrate-binding domain-containing protein n=1 Tax=Zooshikella harenae TaxID=2827238 RepID=A0ABS5ZGM4_9GAMM|nr:transporter substrate-binding domain-containing protein [Zooshikella harenae]MBU2713023.1 transporter substrate-binding domain-containing protein [Zooshikella harenae]
MHYITEEYPPYNYISNDKLVGIGVDVLIASSKMVDCPVHRSDIRVLPWARAYKMTKEKKDTVLFTIAKNKEREALFLWAGPFVEAKNVLIAKKTSNITINNYDLNKWVIGAIRDDISFLLASKSGISEDRFRFARLPDHLAHMLSKGRIDMWAYSDHSAWWILRKHGYDRADFEVVKVLGVYKDFFAFNLRSNPTAVELLQTGIDMLKNTPGKIGKSMMEDILLKYL